MPSEYPTVLHNPKVLCVNLSEAAKLLGIAKSTATVLADRLAQALTDRGYTVNHVNALAEHAEARRG